MFTFSFFKKRTGLRIATALIFSLVGTPAIAKKPAAPCLPTDKAEITQVKGYPFMVLDFTKSSVACLEKYTWSASWKDLVHVVRDEDQEAKNIVLDAARIHVAEKHPSVVFFGHPDPSGAGHDVAINEIWRNGGARAAPITVNNGYTISMLANQDPEVQKQRAIVLQRVVDRGHEVLDIANGVKQ